MDNTQSQLEQKRTKISQARAENINNDRKFAERICQEMKMSEEQIFAISALSTYQLVHQLNEGKLTSKNIIAAVCFLTSRIGYELCLVTQTNFVQAFKLAHKCDEARKETGKKNWTFDCGGKFNSDKYLPPLFGIPISIKDVYDMKSFYTTVGCINGLEKVKQENSPIVTCFRNSGMIPFVRSNTPQLGMTFETSNSIWGRALNPWNRERSTGGSSGGQGGLISSGCSFLGIGSDIGGSVRIPSILCGISGLKMSSKRISNRYHVVPDEAFWGFYTTVPNCLGPLGRCAQDLALFSMVATTEQFYGGEEDLYIKIVPFDPQEYTLISNGEQKLRIGYLPEFKLVEPAPAHRRAMEEAMSILKAKGFELIEIEVPNQKQIVVEFMSEFFADGGEVFRKMLNGEQPIEEYRNFFHLTDLSNEERQKLCEETKKNDQRSFDLVIQKSAAMTTPQYHRHMGVIQNLRADWMKYWKSKKLDLIIQPAFSMTALQHGKSSSTLVSILYTYIWNLLDMAAGVTPVTTVREDEQVYQSKYNDALTEELKKIAQGSMGLPAGIQVIGMPYREERVLGLMRLLEKEIKFDRVKNMENMQK